MDTNKLETLITAAEMGSFTKAAELLGYTQSGLTHMMNALERELDIRLLVRTHSGIALSPNGKMLLPAIRRLLDAEKSLQREIDLVRDRRNDTLRIGSYASMAMHWLPLVLQRFQAEFPEVSVNVRMGTIEEIYSWVQDGTADLAFVSQQDGMRLKWIHLKDDPLLAILPPDYTGDFGESFPLHAFDRQQFLMPNAGFERDILKYLHAYGVEPEIKPSYVDDPVLISMVEHGLGISMLSELVMAGRDSRAQVLPVDPPVSRSLGIILDGSHGTPPLTQKFITCTKAALESAGLV